MKTKLTDYLPLAAIAAGAFLLKKQSVSGLGRCGVSGFGDYDFVDSFTPEEMFNMQHGNVWYVTATDALMSGWGGAYGRKSKIFVICENESEALTCMENMRRHSKEMKYINWGFGPLPSLSGNKYRVSVYDYTHCRLWNGSYYE